MINPKFYIILLLMSGFLPINLRAQAPDIISDTALIAVPIDTSLNNTLEDTLLSQTDSVQQESLLPDKYLITQKMLWGKKGLMRNFKKFELSQESRDFEDDIRNTMFKAHRYIGYATLAGMIAEGIVGERLYRGHKYLKDLHEGIASAVNIGYFSTAGLALFAPPPSGNRPSGFSTYKLHKYLAIVHLSSMIATNILSGMLESNPDLKPYHRAAAYTAFSSFFVSMVVIHF